MATTKQAVISLLTEHLSYTPLTLLDDIINTINELVYRAVSAVEQGLTSAAPASLGFDTAASQDQVSDPARREIENGVHQLETLLETAVDKYFDKMEIYVLRNILFIPEDVAPYARLPHYKDLDFTAQQNNATPETLNKLRRKVHETRRLQNALQAEAASNAALISNLKTILAPAASDAQPSQNLSFLTAGPAAASLNLQQAYNANEMSLTNQTKSATAQLPLLRQLLVDLRQRLDSGSLKAPQTAKSEEKRDYLEGRAKDVLERQGVDVESGEGLIGRQELNKSVGKEDIQSIEAIAGALDGARENQRMEE